jgi:alanine racemase
MRGYTTREIASIVSGQISGDNDPLILHLVTDSRKILDPEHSLFIAIPGERRDGHQFIPEAVQQGVNSFMVNRVPEDAPSGLIFIIVPDTLSSLQQLAAHHRSSFHYPVIGLTGSNGKTIVKEWLNHLLHDRKRIVRSPKSYNSQLGVPLSIWQMHEDAELAIIEAGISRKGEMERLEKMIKPRIGIFTNIGEAHNEGFSSVREKIREKLILFQDSDVLIYCRDYSELHEEARIFSDKHQLKLVDWGRDKASTIILDDVRQEAGGSHIRLLHQGDAVEFFIPFTGAAPVENAVSCAVLLLHLGLSDVLVSGMASLPSLSMRLEMRNGIHGCTIINDSYSADLSSLKLALDFLQQQPQHEKKTVILSDIPESGRNEEELYREVASMLRQRGVSSLKAIGPAISKYDHIFNNEGIPTESWLATEEFVHHFNPMAYRDETILIKGARAFGFEQVNQLLEVKLHRTVLSVNLSAITANLDAYRKMLGKGTKIMVMVKAFSYGSGSYEIASLLQFHKVDYLAVAYADEGVELRKAGISLPIMVMNPEPSSFPLLVNFDLQPEIYSFDILRAFRDFLSQDGITEFPVHIKLDTGMHRLGFDLSEIVELATELRETGILRVVTVFSHLVGSEDAGEDEFTREQGRLFIEACQKLKDIIGYGFTRHLANTAAILRHPQLQLDMVRLGIGLYGVNTTSDRQPILQEAASLTTTIAQIRKVRAGQTVGYNRKGKLWKDSLIATIRIGYADGFPRSLGNGRGSVMIGGRLYPIIGSVCMDMTMVDITENPEISLSEEVVLFGKGLSLNTLAEWAGTIPYDIMTGISQRVNRVYIED